MFGWVTFVQANSYLWIWYRLFHIEERFDFLKVVVFEYNDVYLEAFNHTSYGMIWNSCIIGVMLVFLSLNNLQ